ncbi:hypothetical protein AAHE18_11G050200 [Arachis hypogaea]
MTNIFIPLHSIFLNTIINLNLFILLSVAAITVIITITTTATTTTTFIVIQRYQFIILGSLSLQPRNPLTKFNELPLPTLKRRLIGPTAVPFPRSINPSLGSITFLFQPTLLSFQFNALLHKILNNTSLIIPFLLLFQELGLFKLQLHVPIPKRLTQILLFFQFVLHLQTMHALSSIGRIRINILLLLNLNEDL